MNRSAIVLLFAILAGCRSTGPSLDSLRNPELCRNGTAVEVAWPARLYPATVLRDLDDTGMCLVNYTDENRSWTERVAPERIYDLSSGSGATECRSGNDVLVDWAGTHWYPAVVRESPDAEGQCPVRYVDFTGDWDENVALERVRAAEQG
ncbi:MAG: hypothetical protein AAFX94_03285 [Myxococcota bacterium]